MKRLSNQKYGQDSPKTLRRQIKTVKKHKDVITVKNQDSSCLQAEPGGCGWKNRKADVLT